MGNNLDLKKKKKQGVKPGFHRCKILFFYSVDIIIYSSFFHSVLIAEQQSCGGQKEYVLLQIKQTISETESTLFLCQNITFAVRHPPS